MATAEGSAPGRGGFDYAAVGHVTIDVLEDGTRRPGGTAFYSALQAARLGLRTLILTAAVAEDVEPLLAPYSSEFELRILPASATTTLATRGRGSGREQRLLSWAGPIEPQRLPAAEIVHLAPVARELGPGWRAAAGLVGLTPQGLARGWDGVGAVVRPRPAAGYEQLASCCDAIVLAAGEREWCAELLAAGVRSGAAVAVTAGEQPTSILDGDDAELRVAVAPGPAVADDLGAGDVFAAAFFVALAGGSDPAAAADFAHAAAAVRMAGVGAGAIGDGAAVARRLREAGGPGELGPDGER
jgi:sugar/nucleoside kinase (ribokinase family)